ncbi:MAG: hypothetical protein COB02_16690 [Candidatus Cloacimonadota bacterium]|nr:MAG: hypothetical protein COB02_16690 [Candidatus Cloacimonadota bacterium]
MFQIIFQIIIFISLVSFTYCKPLAHIQDSDILSTLINLSDPTQVNSMEQLETNMIAIKTIFGDLENKRGFVDPRGAFPTIYQVTTSKGLQKIISSENGEGPFNNPSMVRCFALQFGKLYLKNLHGHLTNGPVSEGWSTYYKMATSPKIHILQIMGAGANVHINLDLTTALQTCEAPKTFLKDFMQAGKPLVQEIPKMAKDLQTIYDIDPKLTYGLFKMYFIGTAGDLIFKLFNFKGNTSSAIFQTLRWMGFKNHKSLTRLHNPKWYTVIPHAREALLRKKMRTIWKASNFVLNKWIHIAHTKSVNEAENSLNHIFKDAIKNIGFNLFKKQKNSQSLIGLD